MEFMRDFPDDAACLEWLWRERYAPDGHHTYCAKCDRERKFHKVNGRPTWDCDHCGHHINPLAGTIFKKSSTSLHLWFYAIHLMTSTRCGIAAKQLERELGVTYKTAWRMFTLIRNRLMADDGEPLSGVVEVDETSVEGRPRKHMGRTEAARLRERSRATVIAAVERSGRIKAKVLESRRGPAVPATVVEWVRPSQSSTRMNGPLTTRSTATSTTVGFATRRANT
jgi:transposase-like protein